MGTAVASTRAPLSYSAAGRNRPAIRPDSPRMSPSPSLRPLAWLLAVLAIALTQVMLLTNPGYLSHDELQWGARAATAGFNQLPWVGWTQIAAFQFRPLTFNLWLALSWLAFDTPVAMHGLWLALGFGVCTLLYLTLRRLRAPAPLALAGSMAFAVNPFAIYVHGWVATLGELLWVGAALATAWGVLGRRRDDLRPAFAIAFIGTTIALLAKEAAIAMGPLLLLAWLMSGRERRWLGALLGSTVPTAVYLALRLPVLLFAPRPNGAYAWSLDSMPLRWAEMQLWPFLVTTFELAGVAHASIARLVLAATIATVLALCVWRAGGHRNALAYLLGGALALAPALLLEVGYPQYGYGYSVLVTVCLTLAWPRLHIRWRWLIAIALLMSVWHGVNVQRELRRVGALQARFTPSLRTAAASPNAADIALYVQRAGDVGLYGRLILGETDPQGNRPRTMIQLVQRRELSSHVVNLDGGITARQPDQ